MRRYREENRGQREDAKLLALKMKEMALNQGMQAAPRSWKSILPYSLQKEHRLAGTLSLAY